MPHAAAGLPVPYLIRCIATWATLLACCCRSSRLSFIGRWKQRFELMHAQQAEHAPQPPSMQHSAQAAAAQLFGGASAAAGESIGTALVTVCDHMRQQHMAPSAPLLIAADTAGCCYPWCQTCKTPSVAHAAARSRCTMCLIACNSVRLNLHNLCCAGSPRSHGTAVHMCAEQGACCW